MYNNLIKVLKILNASQIKQFKILIFLMFFAMFFETIGISSLVPLINYFTEGNLLPNYDLNLNHFFEKIGVKENDILNFILIFIFSIYLIKNLYLAFYTWVESKFAYKVRFDLGVTLFNHYLNKSYLFHVQNNSSNLIAKITQETSVYGNTLIHVSLLFTEIFIITGITIFLLIAKPLETLIIIIICFLLAASFYFIIKKKVFLLGKRRKQAEKTRMKSLQQGFGAIKDIIIFKVQKTFIDAFSSDSDNLAEVGFKSHFISTIPRIWFELSAITVIVFVIFYLSLQKLEFGSIMATIGIFLVCLLRIIPAANRILVALQYIKFAEPALNGLVTDLESLNFEMPNVKKKENDIIEFHNEIKFENVSFNYPKYQKSVLKNLNFSIKKNEFIGIIGETGTGKSTFADLLIGLIEPVSGVIKVDGNSLNQKLNVWKKNFGYVPQNLYLIDDTIKKNIAFGKKESEISNLSIENCIAKSQLSIFISSLKKGIETIVGERGVKISGGEKQRIGIARALYNDPKILIFDEATSALDMDTESKILKILLDLKMKKTIIFITHRKSSLNICDKIFKIENNEIKEIKKNELSS